MKATDIPQTIDDYISGFPPVIRNKLTEMRSTIRKAAPDASEKISYQMPTYYLFGNLVHFAAHLNHIGFYPAPSAIEAFKKKLSDYQTSKGAIQFPLEKPLPLDLISDITVFRVQENLKTEELKELKKKKKM